MLSNPNEELNRLRAYLMKHHNDLWSEVKALPLRKGMAKVCEVAGVEFDPSDPIGATVTVVIKAFREAAANQKSDA